MTIEPLFAVMFGGWEIVLILAIVGVLALAVVVSVITIAVVLVKRERANKQAPAGTQPPPLR
ncbi:MAG: hypothetical protein IPK15_24835 [Verrucomicrobia bacterium]|nr:hypothetical protein [Verrucomicrobiota bacterium]